MGPSLYLLKIPTFLLFCFVLFLFVVLFVVVFCCFCFLRESVCFSFQPIGFDWFSWKGLTSFYVIFNTGAHQY